MYSNQDASCIDKLYELGIKPSRNQLEFATLKKALVKFDLSTISKKVKRNTQKKPIDTLRFFVEELTLQEDGFLSDDQMLNLIFILLTQTKKGSRSSELFEYVKEQIAGKNSADVFSILDLLNQEQILNSNTYNAVMNLMKSKDDDSFVQKKGWNKDPIWALEFGLTKLKKNKIVSEVSFNFFCMGYVSELKSDNSLMKGTRRDHLKALVALIVVLEKNKLLNEAIVNQFFKHKTSYPIFKECVALITEQELCKVTVVKESDNRGNLFYKKSTIPEVIQKRFNEDDCYIGRRAILHLVNNDAYIHWEQDFEILSKKMDVNTVLQFNIMQPGVYCGWPTNTEGLSSFDKILKANMGKHYSECFALSCTLNEVKTECGISPREKNVLNLESFKLINDKIHANHFDNDENLFDFFRMLKVFAVYDICNNYPELLLRILNEVDGAALSPYKKLVKDIIHFEKNGLLREDIITILLDKSPSENLLKGLVLLGNYSICTVGNAKLLKESQTPLKVAKSIEAEHIAAASQYNKDKIISDMFLNIFSFFHTSDDKKTLANLRSSCKQFGHLTKGNT